MLQLHQGFGIATAALMAATVVTGQLNYSDRFGGSGSSGNYEAWHGAFEATTALSFATAGLLAILTPTPFEHKSDGVDTVTSTSGHAGRDHRHGRRGPADGPSPARVT